MGFVYVLVCERHIWETLPWSWQPELDKKIYSEKGIFLLLSWHPEFPISPFFLPLSHPLPVGDQFLLCQAYFFWIPFAVMSRYTCVFLHPIFLHGRSHSTDTVWHLALSSLTVMSCRSLHIISAYWALLDTAKFPSGRTAPICTTICCVREWLFPQRFTNRICCCMSKFLLVWEVRIGISRLFNL